MTYLGSSGIFNQTCRGISGCLIKLILLSFVIPERLLTGVVVCVVMPPIEDFQPFIWGRCRVFWSSRYVAPAWNVGLCGLSHYGVSAGADGAKYFLTDGGVVATPAADLLTTAAFGSWRPAAVALNAAEGCFGPAAGCSVLI